MSKLKSVYFTIILFCSVYVHAQDIELTKQDKKEYAVFLNLMNWDEDTNTLESIEYLNVNWKPEFEIMVLELLYFSKSVKRDFRLLELMHVKTGKDFGIDFNRWYGFGLRTKN